GDAVREHPPHGVDDLLAAAIADGDDQVAAGVLRRLPLDALDGGEGRRRDELAAADGTDAARSRRLRLRLEEAIDALLDETEDARHLLGRAFAVVGREHPDRDDRYLEVVAPLHEAGERLSAAAVPLVHRRHFGEPR